MTTRAKPGGRSCTLRRRPEGSPDLAAAARKVADHLGNHPPPDPLHRAGGRLDALRDVIYHLRDLLTSPPSALHAHVCLMARYIKAMGIKMVLSGEGSDELFGGYLYFHKAPNARSSTRRRAQAVRPAPLRLPAANKSMAAWGVGGPRCPSSTREFMDVAMRLNPADKMCGKGKIEKQYPAGSLRGSAAPRGGVAPEGAVPPTAWATPG